jgi:hypothetical protein
MKFIVETKQTQEFSLEVRDLSKPSIQGAASGRWYHTTRPATAHDIVLALRADGPLRDLVLAGLEGSDPRLPDLSGNRAVMDLMRQQPDCAHTAIGSCERCK